MLLLLFISGTSDLWKCSPRNNRTDKAIRKSEVSVAFSVSLKGIFWPLDFAVTMKKAIERVITCYPYHMTIRSAWTLSHTLAEAELDFLQNDGIANHII